MIFVLRNPMQRAVSDYWYNLQLGYLPPTESLENILQKQGADHFLIRTGFYFEQLEVFLKYFSKAQIHLLISEQLKTNRTESLQEVCRFLNIRTDVEFNTIEDHNTTLYPRNLHHYQRFHRLLPGLNQAMVQRPALRPVRRRLFFSKRRQKPALAPQTKAALQALFLPQIEALENTWNLDLQHWK